MLAHGSLHGYSALIDAMILVAYTWRTRSRLKREHWILSPSCYREANFRCPRKYSKITTEV